MREYDYIVFDESELTLEHFGTPTKNSRIFPAATACKTNSICDFYGCRHV